MSSRVKVLMFIIGLGAFLYGVNVHAGMRCGTSLIEIGDAEYVVDQACGSPQSEHQVGRGRNGEGDESYAYYNINGHVIEIHYIDAHVYSIGDDGNIH